MPASLARASTLVSVIRLRLDMVVRPAHRQRQRKVKSVILACQNLATVMPGRQSVKDHVKVDRALLQLDVDAGSITKFLSNGAAILVCTSRG